MPEKDKTPRVNIRLEIKDNLLVINYIISNAKKATFNPFKGDKVQGV
jgi:hypothetical protein